MDDLLWAEDLQSHRVPSLYYLNDEEGVSGPNLICDWNGSPSDVNELDIDILSMLREQELSAATRQVEPEPEPEAQLDKDSSDYPNPTTEIAKSILKPSWIVKGSDPQIQLDFLTVPPVATGLLRRIIRSTRAAKPPNKTKQMTPIPERIETTPIPTSAQKSVKERKTARASTSKPIKEKTSHHPKSWDESSNEDHCKKDRSSFLPSGSSDYPVVVD